jgi:hypothetical protein
MIYLPLFETIFLSFQIHQRLLTSNLEYLDPICLVCQTRLVCKHLIVTKWAKYFLIRFQKKQFYTAICLHQDLQNLINKLSIQTSFLKLQFSITKRSLYQFILVGNCIYREIFKSL